MENQNDEIDLNDKGGLPPSVTKKLKSISKAIDVEKKETQERNSKIDRYNNFAMLTPTQRVETLSMDLLQKINFIRLEHWKNMDSLWF